MAKDLVEAFPAARDVFDRADAALGFALSTLCFEGPAEELTLTHNAQAGVARPRRRCLGCDARCDRREASSPRPAIRSASSRPIMRPSRCRSRTRCVWCGVVDS
jgi:hypothetical protein